MKIALLLIFSTIATYTSFAERIGTKAKRPATTSFAERVGTKAKRPATTSRRISVLRTPKNTLGISLSIDDFKEIKEKTDSSKTFCRNCELVVDQILASRRRGANKNSMKVFLKKLCEIFTDWGPVDCNGNTDIEIDTILYIIDNKKDLTSKRVCAIRFPNKGCVDPKANKWNVGIPPPVKPSNIHHRTHYEASPSDLEILHLTDFHFDPLYTPGADADCAVTLCCQISNGPPTVPENAAGFWGDYHVCDMPWHTITDFMFYLISRHKKFDYVYYTGDIISHRSWSTSKAKNAATIRNLFQLFSEIFADTPVYPILGNHESHPTDFFSPKNVQSNSKISTNWVFDVAATEWERWLPKSAIATIRKGGYYTVLTKSGFRIVALNSNVCYISNFWLFYDDEDPYDQLKWLVKVLSQAEKDGEKVHILSHIPPGHTECLQQWSNQFRRIVNRFAPIITAQFNGHSHADELRFFYDLNNKKKIINVAFVGGSFTTFVAYNPNYRIYDIDTDDYSVSDYDHYTFNLTEANLDPVKRPSWYKLYSFKEAYGLKNTNYTSLADLVDRMYNDESLLKKYYRYRVRDSDPLMASACEDKTCLQKLLCSIVSVESASALKC